MPKVSNRDLERWRGKVLELERSGSAQQADWDALRAGEKNLGSRKLKELREQAQKLINAAGPASDRADKLDLRSEFEKAKRIYEEIAAKMDRVYDTTFHGIPVVDADEAEAMGRRVNALNVAVAAMRTKSDANERMARLLNLMVPEVDPEKATTELEQAVQSYLAPLALTKGDVPPAEIVRLAANEITRLQTALERKLRVVG